MMDTLRKKTQKYKFTNDVSQMEISEFVINQNSSENFEAITE